MRTLSYLTATLLAALLTAGGVLANPSAAHAPDPTASDRAGSSLDATVNKVVDAINAREYAKVKKFANKAEALRLKQARKNGYRFDVTRKCDPSSSDPNCTVEQTKPGDIFVQAWYFKKRQGKWILTSHFSSGSS